MTRSDTTHGELFVECKYGAKVAPWTLFEEVCVRAAAEGKVPVLCLKKRSGKGFLVVTHCDDLIEVAAARERALWETSSQSHTCEI